MVKTLIYAGDGKPLAALVTGESDLNEGRLRRLAGVVNLRMATAEEIQKWTGAPLGFSGPVGLEGIPIYADWDAARVSDFVTGANQKDRHLKGVNLGRDFKAAKLGDLRYAREGDLCPQCRSPLKVITTMEIGHIFKLGTRYSEALEAKFVDEKGKRRPALMGCYGIGVNRVMAAVVEEHQDEKGIAWPKGVAPYQVHLLTVNETDSETRDAAEKLYEEWGRAGFEVLYDNRNERAGVKFHDADLIGIPLQAILGEKNLKKGLVDFKTRQDGKSELVPLQDALKFVRKFYSGNG